jgi:hypothetical protein
MAENNRVSIAALAPLPTAMGSMDFSAYSVARGTGEIGIRMASGAQRGSPPAVAFASLPPANRGTLEVVCLVNPKS